jgi:hypothetical protein
MAVFKASRYFEPRKSAHSLLIPFKSHSFQLSNGSKNLFYTLAEEKIEK